MSERCVIFIAQFEHDEHVGIKKEFGESSFQGGRGLYKQRNMHIVALKERFLSFPGLPSRGIRKKIFGARASRKEFGFRNKGI